MGKDQSLWGRFHHRFARPESLQVRWQEALHIKNSEKGIKELLFLQRQMLEQPDFYLQYYVSFVRDVFQYAGRGASKFFGPQDVQHTEKMLLLAQSLPESQPQLVPMWERLYEIYGDHNRQREALELATRVYHHPDSAAIVREWCVKKMAQQKMVESAYLKIYQHYLSDASSTEVGRLSVRAFLQRSCMVRQGASDEEIRSASQIARTLATHGLDQVKGITTTLGLYTLRIERNPLQAMNYFRHALTIDRDDWQAQQGLLLAALWEQSYELVLTLEEQWTRPLPAFNDALLNLIRAACWLDGHDVAGPVPSTATVLVRSMRKLKDWPAFEHVQPLADLVVGRLYLLEQDIEMAIEYFEKRLPPSHEQQMRRYYYLAWAYVCTGEYEKVSACVVNTRLWSANWTTACLLLECDQVLAEQQDVIDLASATSPLVISSSYASAFQFRIALAGQRVPMEVKWTPGAGLVEEDLEALRSMLGYACYTRNQQMLEELMSLPLWQRLPPVDRLTWQALGHWIAGESEQAIELLKESVDTYQYRRAIQLLLVCLQGQSQNQVALLSNEQVQSGRPLERNNLFQAYYQLTDNETTAALTLLEQIDPPYEARAQFLRGTFLLQQALSEYEKRNGAQAQMYAIESSTHLHHAEHLRSGDGYALPDGYEMYISQAQRLAASDVDEAVNDDTSAIWRETLKQLADKHPDKVVAACEKIRMLAEQEKRLNRDFVLSLGYYLAERCSRLETVELIEKIVQILSYLAEKSLLSEMQYIYDHSMVILTQKRYMQEGEDGRKQIEMQEQTQKFPLALFSVSLQLRYQKMSEASAILKQARPVGSFEQYVQSSLLALFSPDQKFAMQAIPQEKALTVLQQQAYQLLDVLLGILRDEKGYVTLTAAWSSLVAPLAPLVSLERLLLAIYFHKRREQQSLEQFVLLITEMQAHLDGQEWASRVSSLARQLGKRQEMEAAETLWKLLLEHVPTDDIHQEYGEFLKYQAASAYKSKQFDLAVKYLRQLVLLHAEDVHRTEIVLLERQIDLLEEHIVLQHLFVYLGYDIQDYAPGRFQVFARVLAEAPRLRQALLQNDTTVIDQEWSDRVQAHASDVIFLHALAVLYRDIGQQRHASSLSEQEPYLLCSHFLWALLVRSRDFWHYFMEAVAKTASANEEQDSTLDRRSELLRIVLGEQLEVLGQVGQQAFASGQYEWTRFSLRSLYSYVQTEQELKEQLSQLSITCDITGEPEWIEEIVEQVGHVMDNWALSVIQDAKKALEDDQNDHGQKNYMAGIHYLTTFMSLGWTFVPMLHQCLDWYVQWLNDIRAEKEQGKPSQFDLLIALLEKAELLAQRLAEYCEAERGDKDSVESQTLADFYCHQASYASQSSLIMQYCDLALSWQPGYPWALEIKRESLRSDFLLVLRKISNGLKQKKPALADMENALQILKQMEHENMPEDILAEDSATFYFYYAIYHNTQGARVDAIKYAGMALAFAKQAPVLQDEGFVAVVDKYIRQLQASQLKQSRQESGK